MEKQVAPFSATGLFLFVFRGYCKRPVAWNGLKTLLAKGSTHPIKNKYWYSYWYGTSFSLTMDDKKLRSEPHPLFGVEGMGSFLPYHPWKTLILIGRSFMAICSKLQKYFFLTYENLNTNDSFNES